MCSDYDILEPGLLAKHRFLIVRDTEPDLRLLQGPVTAVIHRPRLPLDQECPHFLNYKNRGSTPFYVRSLAGKEEAIAARRNQYSNQPRVSRRAVGWAGVRPV